ncbi:MAG: DegT/DnrJ/EryC1/StrS family aminotransferase [Proteobacteria bacterium]|nr:DegT/DnrJ/EryC1/StrS family aminotransferase [Pseudomonadota bacterium]
MDFIDLKTPYARHKQEIDNSIQRVLDHGRYIMGPEIEELEGRLAAYVGVEHCISAGSGTDALLMAMMALGIGIGDEVITTPFTFIAPAETIAFLGAKPVFVDIDPATYNIDPALIEKAITTKTKAIMPVSLYGQCAEFDEINAIAGAHKIPVIEDGAQSFGATYKGRRSGGLTTIGCTSFFPSKPLGCYGDGGACFTNDGNLATRMSQIRVHGQDRRYHHPVLGFNGRMDTLQAAILLAKLETYDDEVDTRYRLGGRFTDQLARVAPAVTAPYVESYNASVYAQYTVQSENRDLIIKELALIGIPTAVHYPVPLHRQPVFQAIEGVGNQGPFPTSENAASRVFSLPMHPYLSTDDQDKIIDAIASVLGSTS